MSTAQLPIELAQEKAALEQALAANPTDAAAHVKLAQFEAKLWGQDPSLADLDSMVNHLDTALATLPVANHAGVKTFIQQLHQKGAQIGPSLQSGKYARVTALLKGEPIPTAPAPVADSTPVAEPTPTAEPEPAPDPVAAEAPKPASPAPAPAYTPPASGPIVVPEVEVGHVTNEKIKEWIDNGQVVELTNAFPLVDNFRTRRTIAEKISQQRTPMALACLVRLMATGDDALRNEIKKHLGNFEPAFIGQNLHYNPQDSRTKDAVIEIMATLQTPETIEPLSQALSDSDGNVRLHAVEGLSEMIEGSSEWYNQLGQMLLRDPDPRVRKAAMKAFRTADTEEAFYAMETFANDPHFDEALRPTYDQMREKFRKGRRAAAVTEKKGEFQIAGFNTKELAMFGGIAVCAIMVLGVGVKLMSGQSSSANAPASAEISDAEMKQRREAQAAKMKAELEKRGYDVSDFKLGGTD